MHLPLIATFDWMRGEQDGSSAMLGQTGAFGFGVLLSALLFGVRHGVDWDHIAAITDITSSQDERPAAFRFATYYVLGHALVVFVIGSVAILLGQRLPEGVDAFMERIVGFTLILLGIFVFVSLVRHGREFRMRSRWMLVFSGARSVYRKARLRTGPEQTPEEREPVHGHFDDGIALAVAEDVPVSEWHHGHHGRRDHHHHDHPEPDVFMSYSGRSALVVGMAHGIGAETPTQILIFLTAAGAGGKLAGELVLIVFIVGLIASNTLITVGSAFGFLGASRNWTIYLIVAILTGTFSLVIGTMFLLGEGSLLPALFGG